MKKQRTKQRLKRSGPRILKIIVFSVYFKRGGPVYVVFYNKLPWFVSELPEKDISNVVVQCR